MTYKEFIKEQAEEVEAFVGNLIFPFPKEQRQQIGKDIFLLAIKNNIKNWKTIDKAKKIIEGEI